MISRELLANVTLGGVDDQTWDEGGNGGLCEASCSGPWRDGLSDPLFKFSRLLRAQSSVRTT